MRAGKVRKAETAPSTRKGVLLQWICSVLLFTVTLAASCTEKSVRTNPPLSVSSAAVSFVDDDGAAVILDGPRRRVISLYSAHTENLFWIGAGDAVIGGHKTCTYPPEAAPLAVYDYTGDPEYIIAAEPDLVLIRPFIRRRSGDYIEEIIKTGIPVVSLYADAFDNFDGYIRKLAAMTGVDAEAPLALFHEGINNVLAKTRAVPQDKKQRVFFEVTAENVRTAADGSFPALAIAAAGGLNVAAGANPVSGGSSIAAFGIERLIENAARIDVYVAQNGAMNRIRGADEVIARPAYGVIKAIREGRVLVIDEKLISSPTYRFLEGVEEMARFIYPHLDWP
ncbi:MAG: ABC transporter substrate-binding protein [Treponema sp.]|jgi:iron complex transport system substrate-binding protein|nr:ABC transporter substrate-binding protein [Treponema sp.]